MKQSHWLLYVKQRIVIGPGKSRHLPNLSRASWNKTYSETRIELRNLQILRKMLDNSSPFLSSEQPSELKNLDVALNIAGVVKIRSENLRF